jgi:hypothetical protein
MTAPELTNRVILMVAIIIIVFLAWIATSVFLAGITMLPLPSLRCNGFMPINPATIIYQGHEYPLYHVPINGEDHVLALIKPARQQSWFVDPDKLDAPPIIWKGSSRTLEIVRAFDLNETLCKILDNSSDQKNVIY